MLQCAVAARDEKVKSGGMRDSEAKRKKVEMERRERRS